MGSSASSSVPFDYNKQLLEKEGKYSIRVSPEGKEWGATRRCPDARGGLVDRLTWEDGTSSETIWNAFCHGVKEFPENKCFGTRSYIMAEGGVYKYDEEIKGLPMRGAYKWVTYREAKALAEDVGKGLVELGAKKGQKIGIFSPNRLEWMITSLGLYSQGLITVSLYPTLGEDAVEYIGNHAELEFIFVSKENLPALISVLPKLKNLKRIIQFDKLNLLGNVGDAIEEKHQEQVSKASTYVNLSGFAQLLATGRASKANSNPAGPEDLAFVMYTSGTTGKPKGVMISHRAVVSVVGAAQDRFNIKGTDRHVSYLPLAHIFETVVQVVVLGNGGGVGFFQGNIKKLTADFKALQPTILCGVPRVFSKVYQKVFAGVNSKACIAKTLFLRCYHSQCQLLREGKARSTFNDAILSKVKAAVGLQECRIILTGAAPCPGYLMEFLKAVIGATVLQGYGMTETAAGLAITTEDDDTVGHVGPPISCVEVRLHDVPEMGYMHTNEPPTGEICLRGPCIFKGYYKNKRATDETIVDGWLHTGDIGRWNPSGTLSVIDRKKNIFKMSQGEYIAAEKVEGVYGKAAAVGQIWIYGNSFQSFVLAVVVPNVGAVKAHLQDLGKWKTLEKSIIEEGKQEDLDEFELFSKIAKAEEKVVKDFVKASLKTTEKALKGFEKARDIILELNVDKEGNGFNVDNDCLTPTFKLRRPFLLKKYREILQKCYANNGEPADNWPDNLTGSGKGKPESK